MVFKRFEPFDWGTQSQDYVQRPSTDLQTPSTLTADMLAGVEQLDPLLTGGANSVNREHDTWQLLTRPNLIRGQGNLVK